MVDISLEHEYPHTAAMVWSLLANFADMNWAGIQNMAVEGSGIGMLRKIELGMPEPVVEQLQSLDHLAMSFSYTIASGNPLPLKDYQAGARVYAIDKTNCRVEWWCKCQVEGMTDEAIAGILSDSYAGLLKTLASHLSA